MRDKEKQKAYHRLYQERNKAAISAKNKARYWKNREANLAYKRKWGQEHREQRAAYNKKAQRKIRLAQYGLTERQFENLLESVDNRCVICRRKFSEKLKPVVDHCHGTGFVRGVLCRMCNVAEGYLKTPEAVLRLYEYMLKNALFYQGTS